MKIAIVYYSETGTTKAAAKSMESVLVDLGHECIVGAMHKVDPEIIQACDLVCLGSWTAGLFVLFQRPKKPYFRFIQKITTFQNKKVVVFCTYKIAVGKMLEKMIKPLLIKGANVIGRFCFKGPAVNQAFRDWASKLV